MTRFESLLKPNSTSVGHPRSPHLPGGVPRLPVKEPRNASTRARATFSEIREQKFLDMVGNHGLVVYESDGNPEKGTMGNSHERVSAAASVAREYLEAIFVDEGTEGDGAQVAGIQVVDPRTESECSGSGPGPDSDKDQDYYANVGKAIETIRAETPYLFEKDLTYDIYRDDIVFCDPRNRFQGLRFYKYMFLSLRCHSRVFFKHVFVDVKNIWLVQDGVIRVRWTVHGIPRIPWEAEGIFDGVSTYKLDRKGKVYEHAVDNIIFRDPPVFRLPVFFAELSLNRVPAQHPCPGAWCRNQVVRWPMVFGPFSWVRMHMVFLATMQILNMGSSHVNC